VNFVLPLILYTEAIEESENYENNYKHSGLLDFENFINLKIQEMGLFSSIKGIEESPIEDEETAVMLKVKSHKSHGDKNDLNSHSLCNSIFKVDIYGIIREIHSKLHQRDSDIDEETKERMVDLFYELEGHYSVYKSFNVIFGGLFKNKKSIYYLFSTIVSFLILFMIFSIYFGLYKFFINKTLVVNIFLQVQ
jgi:hypothetical protein